MHRTAALSLAVGVLNAAAGAWTLATGYGDGIVGLVLGIAIVTLAAPVPSGTGIAKAARR